MMYSIGLVGVLHQVALGFYIHSVLVILMSEPAVTYIAKHICCYFNGRSVILRTETGYPCGIPITVAGL